MRVDSPNRSAEWPAEYAIFSECFWQFIAVPFVVIPQEVRKRERGETRTAVCCCQDRISFQSGQITVTSQKDAIKELQRKVCFCRPRFFFFSFKFLLFFAAFLRRRCLFGQKCVCASVCGGTSAPKESEKWAKAEADGQLKLSRCLSTCKGAAKKSQAANCHSLKRK